MIDISVVIPNCNGAAFLEPCLRSLACQDYAGYEIVLVDNASRDSSLEIAARLAPHAKIIRNPRNVGFAAAVNAGAHAAAGDWIALLNNDTEVPPDWLCACAAAVGRHPDASFLACRILDARLPGRIYSAGDCFLRAGVGYRRGQGLPDRAEYRREIEIFSACGCAALYRASVLREFGGFDESFFAYLEDVELGLRLQAAGHRGYYVPAAEVGHYGGGTSGGEFSTLSVRLQTRNALLILLKTLPAAIVWRCAPMILLFQAFWAARVVRHARLFSYVRGLTEAVLLAPRMLRARARLNRERRDARGLWERMALSELVARRDYLATGPAYSWSLRAYFKIFRPADARPASARSGGRP